MGAEAAILAGGLATRLHGVADERPKCLVEVNGRPFITYLLDRIRHAGLTSVCMLVGYRAEAVRTFLGTGDAHGLRITYSEEPEPLGTAGAVKHAAGLLDDTFVLMNGDTLSDVDLGALYDVPGNALALCAMDDTRDYGRVDTDADGCVTAFREKTEATGPGLVNAGIYRITRELVDRIPAGRAYSMETELLPGALADGIALQGYPFSGAFVDIGTPDRLAAAHAHPLFQQAGASP